MVEMVVMEVRVVKVSAQVQVVGAVMVGEVDGMLMEITLL